MANSDNVLRGGLTNKKIDVPELLKLVRFEPVVPQIIKGLKVNDSMEEAFIPPAADFELRRIILASTKRGEFAWYRRRKDPIALWRGGSCRFSCYCS